MCQRRVLKKHFRRNNIPTGGVLRNLTYGEEVGCRGQLLMWQRDPIDTAPPLIPLLNTYTPGREFVSHHCHHVSNSILLRVRGEIKHIALHGKLI